MLLQAVPTALKDKGMKAMLLKIAFQVRSIDSVALLGIERVLNGNGVGKAPGFLLLLEPILHDHGNAGGATAIFFLFYERDIQPHARLFRGQQNAAEANYCQQLLHKMLA